MGSYEIIVKIEEMRKRLDEKQYQEALKILDTLDIRKIKNPVDMNVIADVYKQNGRYEEAIELYRRTYHKTKRRKLLFQLVWLSIKCRNINEAEMYLKEYREAAPNDFNIYIFQYKLDKLKGEPYEIQMMSLLELKKNEYLEKWAYELAKLYYKAGMKNECIKECSDLQLWFGEGIYVEKAKILKAYCSGSTDKRKIIEELKQYAEKDTASNSEDYDLSEEE